MRSRALQVRARSIVPLLHNCALILLYMTAVASFSGTVVSQSISDEVHVVPKVKAGAAPQNISDPSFTTHSKPFKVNVDLVLVPVAVTDPMNRLVTGLDKENFEVYDNKQLQTVQHFSSVDAPVSIGLIFDSSGSMVSKIERARQAITEFLNTANPQDEFFLITFNDTPTEASDFTSSIEHIQNKLVYTLPQKRTALLDAVYLGISKMANAKYAKKALLIISDGGDNHSRYTEHEVISLVKEADVLIYAVGIYDSSYPTEEERLGPSLLNEISQLTGGRSFTSIIPKISSGPLPRLQRNCAINMYWAIGRDSRRTMENGTRSRWN